MPPRHISQRELRNDSGDVMRAVDRGDSFIVTRNGVPIATLEPVRANYFTNARAAANAFRGAPRIDFERFHADVDVLIDQDPAPLA